MSAFDKTCGRLRVTVDLKRGDGHAATVECPTGWNDACPVVKHTVSVDELRDLHYLIGRALAAVGA